MTSYSMHGSSRGVHIRSFIVRRAISRPRAIQLLISIYFNATQLSVMPPKRKQPKEAEYSSDGSEESEDEYHPKKKKKPAAKKAKASAGNVGKAKARRIPLALQVQWLMFPSNFGSRYVSPKCGLFSQPLIRATRLSSWHRRACWFHWPLPTNSFVLSSWMMSPKRLKSGRLPVRARRSPFQLLSSCQSSTGPTFSSKYPPATCVAIPREPLTYSIAFEKGYAPHVAAKSAVLTPIFCEFH
ncbi:hypothetical protein C8J56DRAFT_324615 [Mycena floridula]|nr:hypothetical protein C8J56DRAFT_324615 [Mycena floridula]